MARKGGATRGAQGDEQQDERSAGDIDRQQGLTASRGRSRTTGGGGGGGGAGRARSRSKSTGKSGGARGRSASVKGRLGGTVGGGLSDVRERVADTSDTFSGKGKGGESAATSKGRGRSSSKGAAKRGISAGAAKKKRGAIGSGIPGERERERDWDTGKSKGSSKGKGKTAGRGTTDDDEGESRRPTFGGETGEDEGGNEEDISDTDLLAPSKGSSGKKSFGKSRTGGISAARKTGKLAA